MFWFFSLGLIALAAFVVWLPIFERKEEELAQRKSELNLLKAQLNDLEADFTSGDVSEEQYKPRKLALQRAILRTAKERTTEGRVTKTAAIKHIWPVLIALPVMTFGIYALVGSPETPSARFAEQEKQDVQSVDDMVSGLAARLQQNPDDPDGWAMLGRSYMTQNNFDGAVAAYTQLLKLIPEVSSAHSALGEAETYANRGYVSERAKEAFSRALELDGNDPRARYYLGLFDYQNENWQAAFDTWIALAKSTPADAPWLDRVKQDAGQAALALGINLEDHWPHKEGEATGATEDQKEMIRGMVDGLAARLEETPEDPEGWRMLARSYNVLERKEDEAYALLRLSEIQPDNIDAQLDYAQAALPLIESKGLPIPEPLAAALQRILKIEPANPIALFYLGQAAAEQGDKEKALSYWQTLLPSLPEGSAERKLVEDSIAGLPD